MCATLVEVPAGQARAARLPSVTSVYGVGVGPPRALPPPSPHPPCVPQLQLDDDREPSPCRVVDDAQFTLDDDRLHHRLSDRPNRFSSFQAEERVSDAKHRAWLKVVLVAAVSKKCGSPLIRG